MTHDTVDTAPLSRTCTPIPAPPVACLRVLPTVVAIDFDAFDRIFAKLVAGEPADTYSNFCPHENRDACQCPKRICFLDKGLVYGTRDGGDTALVIPKPTVQVSSSQ